MSNLAEQIAVLDGLSAVRPGYADGRTGAGRAAVDQYGRVVGQGMLSRRNVLDASEGANYAGGSSYAPGLPLMPSTVGLADMPGTLPPRTHVIDPSGGALYSGGSSYAPGMPLLTSTVGLAAADGSAPGGYSDQDLAGAFNALEAVRPGYSDGRTGAGRAAIDQYGTPVMRGVLSRKNVIDASEGANYGGGSSYAPGLPLLPSSIGLAGLDSVSDLAWGGWMNRMRLQNVAGQGALTKARTNVLRTAQALRNATPARQPAVALNLRNAVMQLRKVRAIRKRAVDVLSVRGGVPVMSANPYSPGLSGVSMRGGVPVTQNTSYSPALALWK